MRSAATSLCLSVASLLGLPGRAVSQLPVVHAREIVSFGPRSGLGPVYEPHISVGPDYAFTTWYGIPQSAYAVHDKRTGEWTEGAPGGGVDASVAYDAFNENFVIAVKGTGAANIRIYDPVARTMSFVGPGLTGGVFLDKPWIVRGANDVHRQEFHLAAFDAAAADRLLYGHSTDGGLTWTQYTTGHDGEYGGEPDVARATASSPVYICYTRQAPTRWEFLEVDLSLASPAFDPLLDSLGQPIQVVPRLSCSGGDCTASVPGPFPVKTAAHFSADPSDPNLLYVVYADQAPGSTTDMDVWCVRITQVSAGRWSVGAPVRVNTNTDGLGEETDQCLPDLAVDTAGRVHVVFYDDRAYSQSDSLYQARFDMYYAYSLDGGTTFTDLKLTDPSGDPTLDHGLVDAGNNPSVQPDVPREYPGIATFANEVWMVYAGTSPRDQGTPDQSVMFVSRVFH